MQIRVRPALRLIMPLVFLGSIALWSTSALADTEGAHGDTEAAHGAATAHEGEHHAPEGAPPVNWIDMGYDDKDAHGGTLDKGDAPMAPPLVLALLNFAIFAGILYWKAGPALSKYLANRHESIKNALEEAARLQEQAKEKLAEYSTRIADADAEVNALIEQIRKDAEAEREKIVSDAERQAEQMKKDAEARIESEFLAARRQLEREVVTKAAEVAERLLTEKPQPADHNNLFSGFVTNLKENSAAKSGDADGGWS